MVARYVRRGLAAGLLAGLLAGLFAFFAGEPLLDQAIGLEEASGSGGHSHESGGHGEEEVFSRTIQKAGLFFATGLSGTFLGALFGVAFAYFKGRMESLSDWSRSISLAVVIFAGVVLIPFLKYPPNPPTVGSPETIGIRTLSYFTLIGFSLLAIIGAWYVSKRLRERAVSPPIRHTVVGLGLLVVFGVLLAILPSAANPGNFPAGLLWNFRIASLGTQVVLWAGMGVMFGALCERANRKESLAKEGKEGGAVRQDAGAGVPSPRAQ